MEDQQLADNIKPGYRLSCRDDRLLSKRSTNSRLESDAMIILRDCKQENCTDDEQWLPRLRDHRATRTSSSQSTTLRFNRLFIKPHQSTTAKPMRATSSHLLLIATFVVALFIALLTNPTPTIATTSTSALNGPDRVHVIRQPPAFNPTNYNQTKQTFKENFENIVIHVKENTPIGTKLTDVQPRDAENGALGQQHGSSLHGQQSPNDKAIYAIVGGADQHSFTLRIDERDNKVELVNEVTFDYESNKCNYHVIIRATSLYLRYELNVDVVVEDENDNKPQLEDFAIVFNNYKNNFPTGPIGRVPASDLDVNDVLRYRILSGNNAQLIYLNETNGDIQLSPWLNSNVPMKAVMEVLVSDGFNEVGAKLVLTVNLVTEAMLHNSVVMRLDGVSREDFFARKYDILLNQMARILGPTNLYSTKDIVVFDVEEGNYTSGGMANGGGTIGAAGATITTTAVPPPIDSLASGSNNNNAAGEPMVSPLAGEASTNDLAANASSPSTHRTYHTWVTANSSSGSVYVNVSFSARADGNDVEAYLSRQYIEERISANRLALSQNLDAAVMLQQDNICATEPCQNSQECQLTYRFERASRLFQTSKNIIFRSIKALPSFTCNCPPALIGLRAATNISLRNDSSLSPSETPQQQVCCNCDESRGFDTECDKTTGQCFCKPNHYQPPGNDDYCLACDCYVVGSLSNSCNQTTGQCKCRAGVVGRRCDTCSSPYAEVTLRGCEVIYDACPKTYSDGIWWDKTQLDRLASQQCPPMTSTGTATRFCHRTEGWREANLFDCISNTFTDLHTQYEFLEENKFQMTTNLAVKIASQLRNALNETISSPSMQLYGSDMYISFRLLHHLIQHESRQTGLNLTHRQDRQYIRNIAESVSYILDPAYAKNWPEIAKRSPNGGAEYLLKLMDSYGKVLIDSQSDTFTQPFEVTTRYFQFGMDTLHLDQLYDMNKWSFPVPPNGPSNSPFGGLPSGSAHFPSSPPYATDPFDSALGSSGGLASSPFGLPSGGPSLRGHGEPSASGPFNADGLSIYLDFTTSLRDGSPSVIIPKYDNYPMPSEQANQQEQQSTRALIPLKTLRMRPPKELSGALYYPAAAARSRAKREELIIPDNGNLRNQKPPVVVYSIYKTLGPLLPTEYDNSVQNRLGMLATANSPVVWLTVRPQNSSDFLNKNIQPKITYMLKMVEPMGKTRPQCAIWDFIGPSAGATGSGLVTAAASSSSGQVKNANVTSSSTGVPYGIKQTGRFTTKGCEIKGVHPNHRLRYKYDYVNCSCDRLGAVIVLMDSAANHDYLTVDGTSSFKDLALVIALGVSIAILVATLFVLSCIRGHSIKSNSNSINKNLIAILIIIETLILYSILSRGSLNQHEYQCKLIAIFLHYFSISLFFWLLVNAIHFYRMLTELRDINHGPMKFYHVLGYAVPAFFVTIAVGLRIEQFGNYLFCWLSIHEPIIWSMFGPISVVAMMTIILYKLALCNSLPLDKNHDDPNGVDLIKTHMLINIVKTPVIGIYWLVAVYAVNEALADSAYLFPVVILFKSITLLLVLCVVDRYIRYNMYVSWLRFKGEKVPFLDDPYGNVVSPLSNSQPWMASMVNSMREGEFGAYGNGVSGAGLDKNQAGQMLYPNHQLITPGFQSSCTDIFRPELLAGMSAASTTSRSTATGTSSSAPYRECRGRSNRLGGAAQDELMDEDEDDVDGGAYGRSRRGHRRRHGKKSHRRHHHHGRHHHHHHHHHRPHHQDDYNMGRDEEEDEELTEYGHHHGHSHGHHHHHSHGRHHHRSGHRSHRSGGGHHERSGGGGGGGGGGSEGHAQQATGTESQHDSLDNILGNDELASSHSSDEDDVSAMLPKKQAEDCTDRQAAQVQHQRTEPSEDPASPRAATGEGSKNELAPNRDGDEQQQTVPMELLRSSSANESTDQQTQQESQATSSKADEFPTRT